MTSTAPPEQAQRGQAAAAGANRRGHPPAGGGQNGVELNALMLTGGLGLRKLTGGERGLPLERGLHRPLLFGACIEVGLDTQCAFQGVAVIFPDPAVDLVLVDASAQQRASRRKTGLLYAEVNQHRVPDMKKLR